MSFKDLIFLIFAAFVIFAGSVVTGSENSDLVVTAELLPIDSVSQASVDPLEESSSKKVQKSIESININSASKDELISLTGIGPALAERILIYKNENGPFKSIEELINIKGIGSKKLVILKKEAVIQ